MVGLQGAAPHEDGVVVGAQAVDQHLREGRREAQGRLGSTILGPLVANEMVGRFGPFQEDEGPVVLVHRHKLTIGGHARVVQHPHRYLDARLAHALDAAPLHLGEGIGAATHTPLHPLADDEVAARGRLAPVGARLQRHVDGGAREQRLVLGPYRCEGVHLAVGAAIGRCESLADDAAVGGHDDGAHRWVGLGREASAARYLQAAPHKLFVQLFLGHILDFSCFLDVAMSG